MASRGGATGSAGRVGATRGAGYGPEKPKRKWVPPKPPDRQKQRLDAREVAVCPTCHLALPCECPESEID